MIYAWFAGQTSDYRPVKKTIYYNTEVVNITITYVVIKTIEKMAEHQGFNSLKLIIEKIKKLFPWCQFGRSVPPTGRQPTPNIKNIMKQR